MVVCLSFHLFVLWSDQINMAAKRGKNEPIACCRRHPFINSRSERHRFRVFYLFIFPRLQSLTTYFPAHARACGPVYVRRAWHPIGILWSTLVCMCLLSLPSLHVIDDTWNVNDWHIAHGVLSRVRIRNHERTMANNRNDFHLDWLAFFFSKRFLIWKSSYSRCYLPKLK